MIRFLGDIKKAFDKKRDLSNLLLDDFFATATADAQVSMTTSFVLVKEFFHSFRFHILDVVARSGDVCDTFRNSSASHVIGISIL